MKKAFPVMICAVFFISGASALIFETLWFRLAGLAIGNSTWASSIVLSTFMCGLAIGSGVAGIIGPKIKNPINMYAILEVIIACSGFAIILIFPKLNSICAPLFAGLAAKAVILNISRAVVAFFIMLIPAIAMGATLPLLIKALFPGMKNFGRVLGILYGWNTLGALTGVLMSEIWLIKGLGVQGAGLFASGLNLTAALLIIATAKKAFQKNAEIAVERTGMFFSRNTILNRYFISAFLSGSVLLALEVIWFRFLMLFFNCHSWNFTLMLAVVLGGISLGGLSASRFFHKWPDFHQFLVYMFIINGFLVIASYGSFGLVLSLFAKYRTDRFISVAAIFLMFPVSFVSGMIFTMLGKSLHQSNLPDSTAAGMIAMANTTGAMIGAFIGGFVLIPVLGVEVSFIFLGIIYGLTSLLFKPKKQMLFKRIHNSYSNMILIVIFGVIVFYSFGRMQNNYLDISADLYTKPTGEKRVAFREGISESIQYLRKDILGKPHYYRLITNNYSMSGTMMAARRYMKLFVYWPVALLEKPENALLICFGCGSTAKALTDTRSLKNIDIVDISKDIVELSSVVFPDPEENPINDPRVQVHIEDGRFYLQTEKKQFDIITAEPPPPLFNGIVNLYSQEYFQLIYNRLSDGGITTYWLPVYQLKDNEAKSIIKAFRNVFKDCSLWTGSGLEWMLVGTKNYNGPVSDFHFSKQWHDRKVSSELQSIGFTSAEQLGSLFIADGDRLDKWLADSKPLVDNYPKRLSSTNREWRKYISKYRLFMDKELSRQNFMASENIRHLWPESMRKAAEKHFPPRDIINDMLVPREVMQYSYLHKLHQCINNPLLFDYISWVFNSDKNAIDIIDSQLKYENEQVYEDGLFYHYAASAAQKGHYLKAENILAKHAKTKPHNILRTTLFRVYLLYSSGKKDEAWKVVQEYIDQEEKQPLKEKRVMKFWNWLNKNI